MAEHIGDDASQTLPDKKLSEAKESRKPGGSDGTNDGLNDLLDSALGDFEKPAAKPTSQDGPEEAHSANEEQKPPKEPSLIPPDQEAMFNQLFSGGGAGGGAPDFEAMMSSVMSELTKGFGQEGDLNSDLATLLQGGGAEGLPGFGSAPPSEGAAPSTTDPLASALGDTVTRLVQSAQDLKDGNVPEEEILRQMESMHLGDASQGQMMPMMQQMMQSLLSKELLYPSLKEVVEKYPKWLEENEGKVEGSDFERYTKQLELMRRLCLEYEAEAPSDSDEMKQQRMALIMDLIQEMEGLGQPPTDIVGEGGTGLGLQFDAQGLPKVPGMPQGDQCSIM